jgi:hypothetical protein
MTNVKITFVHKCGEFNCEYELKNYSEGWAIVEDLGDADIEILSNVKYCPYCGELLKVGE